MTALPSNPPKPRDLLLRDKERNKVGKFLVLAEERGHKWAWVDTCCIDKSSSADLSEAINSMFRYYALADVCYAYLADVPPLSRPTPGRAAASSATDSDAPTLWLKAFRASAWHTRGWTLQELLAPRVVAFLARDWTPAGTKAGLAPLLESVTRVPVDVLTLERDVADVCVAARMSWAAGRRTTRVEDEAYALMGVFGVNMPTLYGEGRRAFYRLQEEIMKRSTDASLFAWGKHDYELELTFRGNEGRGSASRRPSQDAPRLERPEYYLFAPSPSYFLGCGKTTSVNALTVVVSGPCAYFVILS